MVRNSPPTQQAWQTIYSQFQQTLTQLQQARNLRINNPQQAVNHLNSARSILEQHIHKHPWLLPNSAQRRFVEGVRDGGQPLEGALIVSIWTGHNLSGAPIRHSADAVFLWRLYERGNKERVKFESASLKKLAGDMQTQLTQFQEAERTQTDRFDVLYESLTTQQGNQQNAFDNAQQNRTDSWNQQSSSAQNELDSIKNTYDQHMALAAPVEYWETKRQKHHRLMLISGTAVVAGMLFAAWFLTYEIRAIGDALAMPQAIQHTATKSTTAASSVPETTVSVMTSAAANWQLGSFLILALLCFWGIRLLVRIFLSNLHLENDAAERVTMAKTYLSLLRSDGLPKGDNINTVLAALFRPTGDGIVKDEGVPPSTLEWFTKLGK